jgi:hypothetical protein
MGKSSYDKIRKQEAQGCAIHIGSGWKQVEDRRKKGSGGDGACLCTHLVSPEELVHVVWMVEPSALNRLATSSFVTWVQAGRGGGEWESGGHACTRRVGKKEGCRLVESTVFAATLLSLKVDDSSLTLGRQPTFFSSLNSGFVRSRSSRTCRVACEDWFVVSGGRRGDWYRVRAGCCDRVWSASVSRAIACGSTMWWW